jgi:hypothetical protein
MHDVGLKNINSLPYAHAFPLSMLVRKLNLSVPPPLGKINVWLPVAMVAMYGFYSNE